MPQELVAPPPPGPQERAELRARLLQHMPQAMRDRRQWLLWRYEVVEGRPKLQKVPYWVNGAKRNNGKDGQHPLGGPRDVSRLASLEEACARFESTGHYHGVGFAFLQGDGLVAVDLDGLVDADTGEIREHHAAIIKACASYTERSPSGAGLHIICAGSIDKSFKHDPAGVEVYCGDRYFTCTGVPYEGTPDQVRPLEPFALEYLRLVVQRSKDAAAQAKAAAAGAPPLAPPRGKAAPGPSERGHQAGDDFRRVNDAALQALGAWVPSLFPKARVYQQGYRVRSADLGRELEEDLQLMPEGIMDFGEERGMSPIDVVMRWAPGAGTPKDALAWLASQLGIPLERARPPARGHLRVVGVEPEPEIGEPPPHLDEIPPPEDLPEPPPPPSGGKGEGSRKGGGRKRVPLDQGTIDRLLCNFALVYGTDTVWDGERLGVMAVKNLRLLFGNAYVNTWLAHPSRRLLMPDQIRFEPGVDLPEDCVNLFDGLPTEPVPCTEADVKPMLDLLHHLCKVSARTAEQVEEIKLQVLRWCAAIVQRPGIKIRFAIVFHGPQGTGKNLFCDALRKVLGKYGKMVGQAELEDRFNGYMSGKLLLIGNEVVTRQELWHNKNKLKWVITEDEIPIRGMHQEVRWESNHANVIFLSNELMPVALEWDDRRHLVIYTPAAEDPDLYLRVADFMADDGLGKWMHYLQRVDLDDFSEHTKPLMTEAKEALIDLSLKPAERFVAEWLAGLLDLPLRVCSAEQLFRVYQRWCSMNGERDFKGQAMFTRTVERYVRERVEIDPETHKRREPALVYKRVALKPMDAGARTVVRCWLPRGTGPVDGQTEGEWAWSAVVSFEDQLAKFGGRHDDGGAP